MNSITRKLVLSILTVVLTVVALGTTTFAWFTLTNTAVVQPFQAEITADTGIEVALGTPVAGEEDQLNWVTTLTTAVIEDYIESAYGAFAFSHVTTANGTSFYTLGIGALTDAPSSSYLSIPLNFRSNSANRILWSTVSLYSGLQTWNADVAFTGVTGTYVSGNPVEIDASHAFRIAIIGNVSGSTKVVGYELPADIDGRNAVLDGDGAEQNLADGVAVGEGNPGAMNYFYAKNNDLPVGANAVTVLDTIQSLSNEVILDLSASTTAGAANYGQIVIRIWLDGWDANAYNSVLGRMITASFGFTGTTI
jgi:hypothetical protein